MARRKGNNTRHSECERKKNTRNELKAVIIACEDSMSSRLYFLAIFEELKKNHQITASSLVVAEHKHTNPKGVLDDLLNYPGYQDFDHKWIVIDRDVSRPNTGGNSLEEFNGAIDRANAKKIKVAYANPCFEIWFLLHYEYRNTAIDRDELNKQLERDYQYNKSKLLKIEPFLQQTAIKNAKKLIDSWISTQGKAVPATDNPSTTVHELVEILNSLRSIIEH